MMCFSIFCITKSLKLQHYMTLFQSDSMLVTLCDSCIAKPLNLQWRLDMFHSDSTLVTSCDIVSQNHSNFHDIIWHCFTDWIHVSVVSDIMWRCITKSLKRQWHHMTLFHRIKIHVSVVNGIMWHCITKSLKLPWHHMALFHRLNPR